MSVRWVTFFLWAAVAASVVGWGLKLFVSAPPAPRDVRVADAGSALRGDVLRVLGADPVAAAEPAGAAAAAPAADARFALIGVVAPRAAAAPGGVALIAVDGKPPKAYRVGAVVEGQTVLKSVRARGAELGPREGAATIALEIPPPAPAATGVLPGAGAPAGGLPPPQPIPAFGGARPVPRGVPGAVPPGAMPGTYVSPVAGQPAPGAPGAYNPPDADTGANPGMPARLGTQPVPPAGPAVPLMPTQPGSGPEGALVR